MKKGFTLVELLATIIIIGVVALIAVPTVISNITAAREKMYTTQIQNIELAAKKWATEHINELDSTYLNSSFISVQMLKDLEFLSKDKLKNPHTNEEMKGCIEILYDAESKTYKYNYNDSNNDCLTRDEKGYYYQKTLSNEWQKDTTNEKVSLFSYLVGPDNSNIVVTGNGLYDMEDRYVFRGLVDNNYVKIDNTYFRIISIDKTNKTLKLIAVEKSGSAVWGSTETNNSSFNASKIYSSLLNNELYVSLINKNVKWNIGKLEILDNLNLDTVRVYENKTKIESNLGLISMSEYIEASLDSNCSNGNFASCINNTYLNLEDAWTLTTTDTSVVYIDSTRGLLYENDLISSHHNIYRTLNINSSEQKGSGTYIDPFIIELES